MLYSSYPRLNKIRSSGNVSAVKLVKARNFYFKKLHAIRLSPIIEAISLRIENEREPVVISERKPASFHCANIMPECIRWPDITCFLWAN